MLGEFPHKDLHQLAQKHGPIMHLRLGMVPTIVVSSPEAAKLCLKTHDLVFAGRPRSTTTNEASKHISYEQRSLAFSQYGSYWRNLRKMCTLELLSSLKINSFKTMRKEELDLLIKFIQEAAHDHVAVDLSAKVSSLCADMSCCLDSSNPRGYAAIDPKRIAAVKNAAIVSKIFDVFLEKTSDEHLQSKDENKTKNFVDVMLGFMGSEESEYRIEWPNTKTIILGIIHRTYMILGGRYACSLNGHFSNINVVGLERMVDESDLDSLEYLDMIVKETMRLHPVAPLLVPHESLEDCTINGYHVPRKSRLIINVLAIGRDPSVWTEPEKFNPERFVGTTDLKGHDFELIPFGVSQLVHCFGWELPNDHMLPTALDMTEEFGLATPRAKHLLAIPTYFINDI
ncbi:hypothetical protein ACB092_02G145300 [Castanea dentata]